MELESLKYIWHNLPTPVVREPEEEVLALLQRRSRGPVARMRRNLVAELVLIVVTYTPAILFYWIDFGGRLASIGWMLLSLMVFYGGYFYRKNLLLQQMQCVQCEVRSNLQRQLHTLTKYVRFYLLAGTLLLPAMVLLAWFIIRWQLPSVPGSALFYRLEYPHWWSRPLFWVFLLAPFTGVSYYFNKWYVNKLYGRHIKKLQELLQEMNEE
ncbi:MAG TPA: hypothetical protein VGM30_08370 [Puia sp.]|jgi:hypothetical protein